MKGYRLSPQQLRLWQLQQREPSTSYRADCAVLLEGALDQNRLQSSLAAVVSNHEILRTSFSRLPEMTWPLQVISDESRYEWREPIDLSALNGDAQNAQVETLLANQRTIDLESQSPLQVQLVKLDAERHWLCLSLPALCADKLGLRSLVAEISQCYETSSESESIDDEQVQYKVISEWLNELLEAEDTAAGREYWRRVEFADAGTLRLPLETEPAQRVFEPRVQMEHVDDAVSERLRSLAAKNHTSLSTILLTCWQVLLSRLTGQSEIVVGVACDGRTDEDLDNVIGLLTRYVPVKSQLEANQSFLGLAARTSEVVNEASEWQECFTWPQAEQNENTFFPFVFEFGETAQKHSTAGLVFTPGKECVYSEQFRMQLTGVASSDGVEVHWHYDPQCYSATAISDLAAQYQRLLESVSAQPQATISSLNILPSEQREQLLVEFNQTVAAYPDQHCIQQLFEQQVARTPAATAVIYGAETLSYEQLNERANQLAHYLMTLGVGPEVRVGLMVERGVEMVVGLLGILKAGGAYVPLDPDYPADRLSWMLSDSEVPVLVTQQRLLERIAEPSARVVCIDEEWEEINRQSRENPLVETNAENLAYVIYTSGSTGRPKGVMIAHRSILNRLVWVQASFPLAASDRLLQKTPYSFDASVWELFVPLLNGAQLVLAPPGAHQDSAQLVELVQTHGVTILQLVPSMLKVWLETPGAGQCETLRHVFCGGEALGTEVVKRLRELLPVTRVHNLYGPTEVSIDATSWECPRDAVPSVVPIGRPLSNVEVYILDGAQQPVPVGVAGELYVGGAGLARGYLKRAELTAERFVPHPFSRKAGARLYRTGDVARYLRTGEVEYLGRADEQVKIRGFRIELGEIEAVLGAHAAVREAVVVAREEKSGDKRLVAYAVTESEVSGRELREHLRSRLPEYMVPATVVLLNELPLTSNGKLDRRALPAPEEANETDSFVDPRTAVEELLCGIWSEVLGVEPVGVETNFFEMGGHSLLATQVVSRVRETFGVEMALRTIFERPTVAEMSLEIEERLRGGERAERGKIERITRTGGTAPLSFAQRRLWFIDQLEPGSAVYNLPVGVRMTGELDVPALERTLTEMVRRHEVLRTTFASVDGEPVQVISEPAAVELPLIDLSEWEESERELEAGRLAAEESQRPFDLSRGPLLRATLVRLGEREHIVLMTMHHIISDGWSMGVLIREVAALYDAYANRQPSTLPELTLQYADYAAWQREWLQGEVLEGQLAYWREQLGKAPVLELPTDHVRPAVQTFRGASQPLSISKELSDGIKQLSQHEGVTLFMTLLAAYQILLARYSGQRDICVGTPIANRTGVETESLLGFFANTLVLRTDLSDNPTVRELLKRVREVTLSAYAHQDVPFEKLVEELEVERSLSHTPLFQVSLTLQNAPQEALDLPDLALRPIKNEIKNSNFDLSLYVTPLGDHGMIGAAVYNSDLFEAVTIRRMLDHWRNLLTAMVAAPEMRLSELSLLSVDEQEQLVVEFNQTAAEYPNNHTIQQLFEQQVERTPEATALIYGDEVLSYRQLNERANQLARHLQMMGVGPEVRVGLMVERSVVMIVGLLGILKAGGAYLPLDSEYPADRLSWMIEDSEVPVLITQAHLADELAVELTQLVLIDEEWDQISAQPAENPAAGVNPDNLAYVIYTSGSTGRPKGALLHHRGLANLTNAQSRCFQPQPGDRILQFASFSFDASVWETFMALTTGATLVLTPQERLMSATTLVKVLEENQINIATLPPALLAVTQPAPLPELHTLIVAGEACPTEVVSKWGAGRRFFNAYGPTETTVCASVYECDGAEAERVPIGGALTNMQVYVLDEFQQPVPGGVVGELYVGGVGLARGYLKRPELTADRFVPDPFSGVAGARLYRTGDLCRYVGGRGGVEYIGRVDSQVKVRGYRVELGEVEEALQRQAGVSEAAVVLAEIGLQRDRRLVGFVVLEEAADEASEALKESLRESLPEYMVPLVSVLEEMPLTASGKVDRAALKRMADEGGSVGFGTRTNFIEPRTPAEQMLVEIWAEVLGMDEIGIADNFFELGGHSLLATQVISRIRDIFSVELPLRILFEAPTVEGQVLAITRLQAEQEDAAEMASLLEEIKNLPEEELESLLEEQV